MTANHYFYHSFPRRGRDSVDVNAKGLAILSSILDRGLLLTPEMITVSEQLANGSFSKPWNILQKRVSFTDLTPPELLEHAKVFGPFALEWEVPQLIQMGAIPVFYVPTRTTPNTLDGLGSTLLFRLGEIEALLQRLEQLAGRVAQPYWASEDVTYEKNGTLVTVPGCSLAAIAALLRHLNEDIQPIPVLTSTARGLRGYFYPTENLNYTDPLAYYRQREWRILANITKLGEPVTVPATNDEVTALLKLDSAFFSKELNLVDGSWPLARKCQFYRTFNEKPVITTVRRIVAPASAVVSVRDLLHERGANIEIASLEQYSAA